MSAAIVVTVFTLHLGIEGAWAASSAAPARCSPARPVSCDVQGLDSARVVSLARKALTRGQEGLRLEVHSFSRRNDGYLVEFVPALPSIPRVDGIGGGSCVHWVHSIGGDDSLRRHPGPSATPMDSRNDPRRRRSRMANPA